MTGLRLYDSNGKCLLQVGEFGNARIVSKAGVCNTRNVRVAEVSDEESYNVVYIEPVKKV